jgi:hypothetical protein
VARILPGGRDGPAARSVQPVLLLGTGRSYAAPVGSRHLVERKLTALGERLRGLRQELAVTDEQLVVLADEAGDLHLRSLVSETPMAEREHRDAERHAEAMRRHRAEVEAEIQRAEAEQDQLLDRLLEAQG